ncbi:MAG: RluA family pseudouridine synthase [Selenomonadales bacterium]|nr:RluA family pseudouridine synthase [Selenomonadales bacterium]MBR0324633.1 RluA family pseudouridine synthase [Selenomonadales bacterium]
MAGERIDRFLQAENAEMSRAKIQKLIQDGFVTVNHSVVKSNYKLRNRDVIEFTIPEPTEVNIEAEDIALDILYEDADMIIINKARGMVVHPAPGNYTGTLVNALLYHCDDLSGINGELRPGIVHRLDKDTSGVMVAAKNDISHQSLALQIGEKTATRTYLTIVHGNMREDTGTVNAPIGRHPTDRKQMAVVEKNSKSAVTHFRVLERFGQYTFLECKLETGRTHQIRVHMAYIGHPVVADPKYSRSKVPFAIVGQALHSAELRLKHPTSGEEMVFTAPMPIDMEKILHKLRSQKG